jgi:hypothetical protein
MHQGEDLWMRDTIAFFFIVKRNFMSRRMMGDERGKNRVIEVESFVLTEKLK